MNMETLNKTSQNLSIEEILNKQENLIQRHESIIQTTLKVIDEKKKNNMLEAKIIEK